MVYKHSTIKDLIDYFRRHPGIEVFITDLALALNREDKHNIMAGVTRMIADNRLPGLQTRRRGGPWYYIPQNGKVEVPVQRKPEPDPEKENVVVIDPKYIEVGKTKTEIPIVSDSEGNLYRLIPLE